MTVQEFRATRKEIDRHLPEAKCTETYGGGGYTLTVTLQHKRTVIRESLTAVPANIEAFCDAMVEALKLKIRESRTNAAIDRDIAR